MKDLFSRLEKQIERLVEGSIGRILGLKIQPGTMAGQLARAMEGGVRYGQMGKVYAPDRYDLVLHPQAVETLLEQAPELRDDLVKGMLEAAAVGRLIFVREPNITLTTDPRLSEREVRVIAWHSSNPLEFTQAMPRQKKAQPGRIPEGAHLVLSGSRHFHLDRPVINVGRRRDNQLILDDPHVSRSHAQLRVHDSSFMLFDLGSATGTRVNDRPIKQHILRPGDVITISEVRMVYAEYPDGLPDGFSGYSPPPPSSLAEDPKTQARKKDSDPIS